MGLFGGTKYYVSSVVYNCLGDDKPVNWVATTLTAASIAGAPSLGEYFKDALFGDAAMRIRRFIQWTNGSSEYKEKFGIVSSSFYTDYQTSAEAFQPLVQEELKSFESSIGEFDPGHYAEWWIQENYPERIHQDYTVEENDWEDLDKNIHIDLVITFEDKKIFTISEDSLDRSGLHLYIKYSTASEIKVIYYREHSGNPEYDALFGSRTKLEGTYCPPIPFRIDNKFVSEIDDSLYHLAKRAFNKAMGQNKYTKFENQIKDNESIGDIDFAYFVFGVNINTKTKEGKEYLFKYFQNLYENQPKSQRNSTVFISSSNTANLNYNIALEWENSEHTYKTGKCVEDAEPGKYYITTSQDTTTVLIDQGGEGDAEPREEEQVVAEHVLFCYQINENSYEVYNYTDLRHCNTVYKGRVTTTLGYEGVHDENPSSFIVPLELVTWKELGLVKANTLAQEVYQLVFNCYVKKKKRWYASGFFRAIVIVVIVIIAYCTGQYWAPGWAVSMFGSAQVAGAMIAAGLTVLSEIAARIGGWLGKLIQIVLFIYAVYSAATAIYQSFATATQTAGQGLTVATTPALTESGIVVGNTAATVAGLAAPMAGGAVASGSGFGLALTESAANTFAQTVGASVTATGVATIDVAPSAAWGFLSTAKNLLEISKPIVKGMQLYYKLAVEDYQQTLNHLQGQANELNKQIQEASKIFNSNSIVDVGTILSANYFNMESRDAFLQRTSMVGSDIVELSLAMIHNFTDMTLSTELS